MATNNKEEWVVDNSPLTEENIANGDVVSWKEFNL